MSWGLCDYLLNMILNHWMTNSLSPQILFLCLHPNISGRNVDSLSGEVEDTHTLQPLQGCALQNYSLIPVLKEYRAKGNEVDKGFSSHWLQWSHGIDTISQRNPPPGAVLSPFYHLFEWQNAPWRATQTIGGSGDTHPLYIGSFGVSILCTGN